MIFAGLCIVALAILFGTERICKCLEDAIYSDEEDNRGQN